MSRINNFISWFMNYKEYKLWHPESPGIVVTVRRSWIGRMFKPDLFATLTEKYL